MQDHNEPNDIDSAPEAPTDAQGAKRAYESPRVTSGDVFERIVLSSGADEGVLDC
jgi:hypothetical protein